MRMPVVFFRFDVETELGKVDEQPEEKKKSGHISFNITDIASNVNTGGQTFCIYAIYKDTLLCKYVCIYFHNNYHYESFFNQLIFIILQIVVEIVLSSYLPVLHIGINTT